MKLIADTANLFFFSSLFSISAVSALERQNLRASASTKNTTHSEGGASVILHNTKLNGSGEGNEERELSSIVAGYDLSTSIVSIEQLAITYTLPAGHKGDLYINFLDVNSPTYAVVHAEHVCTFRGGAWCAGGAHTVNFWHTEYNKFPKRDINMMVQLSDVNTNTNVPGGSIVYGADYQTIIKYQYCPEGGYNCGPVDIACPCSCGTYKVGPNYYCRHAWFLRW